MLSLEDSIKNMAVIEAVFRSAKSGSWESPATRVEDGHAGPAGTVLLGPLPVLGPQASSPADYDSIMPVSALQAAEEATKITQS